MYFRIGTHILCNALSKIFYSVKTVPFFPSQAEKRLKKRVKENSFLMDADVYKGSMDRFRILLLKKRQPDQPAAAMKFFSDVSKTESFIISD